MSRIAARGTFAWVVAIALLAAPPLDRGADQAPPTESRSIAVTAWGGEVAAAADDLQARGRSWTVSEPIPAGDAVLVGAEWGGDARTRLQVRTATDGTWGEWHELVMTAGTGPDPESDEAAAANWAASEPLWVGRVDHLQARVMGPGAPPAVTLHTVDIAGDLDFETPEMRRSGVAQASVSEPTMVPRSSWDPNDDCPPRSGPAYASSVRFAVIHHTATSNDYTSSESANIVRSICLYHRNTLGWKHIGYNIVVDRYGYIFEGRDGGVDRPVIGAHSAGFNSGSTGISAIGCYDSSCSGNNSVWRSMLDAVDSVVAWKFFIHSVDPHGTTTEVSGGSNKYPKGEEVTLPTIIGHRDVQSTACPGDNYYNYVRGQEKMADRVAALLPDPPTLPRVAGSDRIATSVELSEWGFLSASHVVIASAENFPDGLAAGPLGGTLRGPVLLSSRSSLPSNVASEIKRLGASYAWIAGGEAALSEQIEADLQSKAGISSDRITRFAGSDRFNTAGKIGWEVVQRANPRAAILAVGHAADPYAAFADALSGAAFGATYRLPVLLVTKDELPPATEWVLANHDWPDGLYVIGGEAAISDDVVIQARLAAGGVSAERLSGRNRFATSVAVAEEWRARGGKEASSVLVATGYEWPDALASGSATASRGTAFLLVDDEDLNRSSDSRDWLKLRASEIYESWVAGGTGAIEESVPRAIAKIIR